ncbi:DUF2189 domain-containing protein [Primorskyibacter aestuariivivens]|uniref:DUF2189 domain-containing protein n=1 Tax=Primorskyibacter aestuariivivens TaxID=1888912 RepID=UPI002301930C|nr:DUF2189 domain-containing protein [Primorskyibacter aestuariivivens]MDA7427871.1 DUF2189 domain-containing protein [Primorskyibacter aestuariivivens]
MAQTIGNPLSWTAQALGLGARNAGEIVAEIASHDDAPIRVRSIGISDLKTALHKGYDDFVAMRTDVMWMVVLYPVIGFALALFAANGTLLPLVFPLMAGFAILGPVAGVGLYEMSRRREAGRDANWRDALGIAFSPAAAPIMVLGGYLLALFTVWMVAAFYIHSATLGPEPHASVGAFLSDVFTTGAGWTMILLGCAVGFVFALLALMVSLVSFPMLVDRHVGLPRAVTTSLAVARKNPVATLAWGLIVAIGLGLGFATLFVGLIFVLPVLGHATWHLYRATVEQAKS